MITASNFFFESSTELKLLKTTAPNSTGAFFKQSTHITLGHMEKIDVLIIGAGVSGSVAALKAAKEGLRTVIVEKKKKPGDPQTRVDITRDSGITEIVQELKLEIGDHSRVSRWFSPKDSFILTSKIGDYFVKRGQEEDSFEVSTLRKAENAGAEVITGVRIEGIKKDGHMVNEVILNSGEEISPGYVIAASGQEPDVLRKMGIKLEEKNPVHFIAYGEISIGLDIPKKVSHIFFDSKTIPHGYFYMGKTSEGLGVSAVVLSSDEIMNVKERYRHFIEHNNTVSGQISKYRVLNSFYSSRYAAEIGERVHGNVLLVGDSGRFMDPLVGYGVNPSIYTGYWAADAIKRQDLAAYKKSIRKTLDEIRNGRKGRNVFLALKNEDFDMLMEGMKELSKEIDIDEFMDNPGRYSLHIAKAVLKKPGLVSMLKYLPSFI